MQPKTQEFYSFMKERESIRLRKAAGLPPPWTEDPILQQYKFTNVRREHDRTTQALITLFYSGIGQSAPMEQILLNCATYRYFGTWEFADALGWQEGFKPKKIIELARDRLAKGKRVFTGAYLVTNLGLKGPKEEIVTNVFLKGVWDNRKKIVEAAKESNSWLQVANVLQTVRGFGGTGFMAKETLLDTMHCKFWEGGRPSDYSEWTPIGPGGRRGINRILGLSKSFRLTDVVALNALMNITAAQKNYWPEEWGKLAPTDIQFVCCEFDKYCRTASGEGRPRSKYRARV